MVYALVALTLCSVMVGWCDPAFANEGAVATSIGSILANAIPALMLALLVLVAYAQRSGCWRSCAACAAACSTCSATAALQLADDRPLPLARAYDMLPMRLRPAASGEIVAQRYEITLPTPEHHDNWLHAAVMAQDFWHRVTGDARISAAFRRIAGDAGHALGRGFAHVSA